MIVYSKPHKDTLHCTCMYFHQFTPPLHTHISHKNFNSCLSVYVDWSSKFKTFTCMYVKALAVIARVYFKSEFSVGHQSLKCIICNTRAL